MKQTLSFATGLSLSELAARLGTFEALCGALVAIGHQDGLTIGNYDHDAEGNGMIVLKRGKPLAGAPGLIDTGMVYEDGILIEASAYRGVAST